MVLWQVGPFGLGTFFHSRRLRSAPPSWRDSMRLFLRSAMVVILLVCVALPGIGRSWTDKKGKVIEAELVEVKKGVAILKQEDGKVLKLPVNRLSDEDQEFLKQQPEEKQPATGKAGEAGQADCRRRRRNDRRREPGDEQGDSRRPECAARFGAGRGSPLLQRNEPVSVRRDSRQAAAGYGESNPNLLASRTTLDGIWPRPTRSRPSLARVSRSPCTRP